MADEDDVRIDPAAEFTRHAETYHRFMLGLKWAMITVASMIGFLIVGFATSAGFVGGLVVGVLMFGIGTYAMRHGLAHSSEREMVPVLVKRPIR